MMDAIESLFNDAEASIREGEKLIVDGDAVNGLVYLNAAGRSGAIALGIAIATYSQGPKAKKSEVQAFDDVFNRVVHLNERISTYQDPILEEFQVVQPVEKTLN